MDWGDETEPAFALHRVAATGAGDCGDRDGGDCDRLGAVAVLEVLEDARNRGCRKRKGETMKTILIILVAMLAIGCATAPVFGPCTIAAKQSESTPAIKSIATVGDVLLYGVAAYYINRSNDKSGASLPTVGSGTMVNINITGDRNDVQVVGDDVNYVAP